MKIPYTIGALKRNLAIAVSAVGKLVTLCNMVVYSYIVLLIMMYVVSYYIMEDNMKK